jgi:hypothetical protein
VKLKIFLFFLVFLLVEPSFAWAGAKLLLEPKSGNISPNLDVNVNIDPGGTEIKSADASLTFDPAKIEVVSVTLGTYFDDPYKYVDNTKGILNLGGSFNNAFQTTATTGTLATVNLKAKINGSGTVVFNCTAGQTNDCNIHNADNQDIIDCTATVTGNGAYTLAGGTGATPTPTPSPTPPPAGGSPTPTPLGAACYQTCTTNSNCQGNLICREISGSKKCVNANCDTKTNCDCGTTYSNPTPTPSRSPNPPNPSPTSRPAGGSPTPTLPVTGATATTLALLGLGMLVLSGGLWVIKPF